MADSNVKIKIDIDTLASKKNIEVLSKVLGNLDGDLGEIKKEGKETGKQLSLSFNQSTSAFKVFQGVVGAQVVIGALKSIVGSVVSIGTSLAKTAIEGASQFETLTTQFEVLTGSANTAQLVMRDLAQFAAETPFQLDGIAKAGTQLLAFGFQAGELKDRLREIGDVAAASGSDLNEVAVIYGQIAAAGKLTGERLNQLNEKAIPIGPALAKALGQPESKLRDLVSQSKVTSEVFQEAFAAMSAEGGIAFEGMIKRSKTLDGVISTLSDNWTLKMAEVGNSMLPVIKTLAGFAIESIGAFDTKVITSWIQNGVLMGIDAVKTFANSLNSIVAVTRIITNSITILFDGFVAGISAIVSISATIFQTLISTVRAGIEALPDSLVPDGWVEGLRTAEDALSTVADTAAEKVSLAGASMEEDFNDIGSAFTENVISEQQLALLNERLNKAKDTVLKTEAATVEGLGELSKEKNQQKIDDEIELTEKLRELAEEERIVAEELRLAQNNAELARKDAKFAALEQEVGRDRAIRITAERSIVQDKQKLAELDVKTRIEASKKKLKDEQDFQKAMQEEKKKELSNFASFTNSMAQISALGGKKSFAITKALNLASSITTGIQAVQMAIAAPPGLPYNAGSVAVAAAMAAANVARIASQKAPAFEQGGIVGGNSFSGDKVTARVNSREMILNQSQQSQLFQQANGLGGGNSVVPLLQAIHNAIVSNGNTSIQIDGREIISVVRSELAGGRTF